MMSRRFHKGTQSLGGASAAAVAADVAAVSVGVRSASSSAVSTSISPILVLARNPKNCGGRRGNDEDKRPLAVRDIYAGAKVLADDAKEAASRR